ncbi:hypothetical protein NA57DRAFT_17396, partial [Rhizodiscina lignyota]
SDRNQTLIDQKDNEPQQSGDIHTRDTDQQEREISERQHLESSHAQAQPQPHENHAGSVPLHQPVAVAPVRSIHGPNGILGGASAPVNGPMSLNAQLGAPTGPANVFGGGPSAQNEPPPRAQPAQATPQTLPAASFASSTAATVQQSQAAMVGQGQQPILNDALSYLDQVKVQFAERPDVYNKFLDIMKDFKSGAIDTPGVIDRVSNLFAGNPNLIQGFNTFLPPGYKIECGTTDNPNAIRVTTPMGTITSQLPTRPQSNPRQVALGANGMASDDRAYYEGGSRNTSGAWQSQAAQGAQDSAYGADRRGASGAGYAGSIAQNTSAPLSPEVQRAQQIANQDAAMIHQQEQRGVSQLQNAASVAGSGQGVSSIPGVSLTSFSEQAVNGLGGILPQGMQAGALEKRGPVEFNHAISYVNKIKNRFSAQPDIYKQFLEILQTYQRESKPIQEVYGQVTQLFSSAPDLLEDFKQFLPESAAHAKAMAASRGEEAMLSNMRNDPAYVAAMPQQLHTPRQDQTRMPPLGNFAPTPNTGRETKRKRQDRQAPGPSSAATAMPVGPDASAQAMRAGYPGGHVAKKQPHGVKPVTATDLPPVSPTLVPPQPSPLPPSTSKMPTPDELQFFERAKKFISNKSGTNEFLKLCQLFSEQLIDKSSLMRRAHNYFGSNPELMQFFKKFMEYKDEDEEIENKPRARGSPGRVALMSCRSYGPSYRLLPKRETQAVCSGRDELCRSVLNDEWASHPTWASEDSGFVAHRKNIHEEGLHRIEEERHDYDFNIEACSRTVQLLEPIAQQMLIASPEDRAGMQLPPGLGGQSETIYKRVIMKIYGRDRGKIVIEEMFRQPYNVIPTVLNRIKQRLEEWKGAQREWEKVWREQTQKIFWRSLDHQSIGAKMADKRQFQTKTLQNEIQVKFQEQKDRRDRGVGTRKFQFSWDIEDVDVLFDAARLVLVFAQMSHQGETTTLEEFLKDFVSTFFGIDRAKIEQSLEMAWHVPSSSDEMDIATPGTNEFASRTRINGRGANLHRAVLERGRAGRTLQPDLDVSVASGSRATTPGVASAAEDDGAAPMEGVEDMQPTEPHMEKWMEYPADGNFANGQQIAINEPFTRTHYHMFCNLPIYCFVRMFLILYERLYNLKKVEADVHDLIRKAMAPKPARDLGMIDKYPSDFFTDVSENANFYQQMIGLFEENLRGDIEVGHIEETLRRYYLENGWQLYSFDKLLASLARFALAVRAGDSKDKTWDIWLAFKKDRAKSETTHEEELAVRRTVQKYIKEGDMYRITLANPTTRVYIRLFPTDETTFDLTEYTEERNWRFYVSAWLHVEPTEGIRDDKVQVPFLRRQHLGEALAASDEMIVSNESLKVRVPLENYKPNFEPDCWEYIINPRALTQTKETEEEMEQRNEQAAEIAEEKIVLNSPWTKDMAKGAVDAKNQEFRHALDE